MLRQYVKSTDFQPGVRGKIGGELRSLDALVADKNTWET